MNTKSIVMNTSNLNRQKQIMYKLLFFCCMLLFVGLYSCSSESTIEEQLPPASIVEDVPIDNSGNDSNREGEEDIGGVTPPTVEPPSSDNTSESNEPSENTRELETIEEKRPTTEVANPSKRNQNSPSTSIVTTPIVPRETTPSRNYGVDQGTFTKPDSREVITKKYEPTSPSSSSKMEDLVDKPSASTANKSEEKVVVATRPEPKPPVVEKPASPPSAKPKADVVIYDYSQRSLAGDFMKFTPKMSSNQVKAVKKRLREAFASNAVIKGEFSDGTSSYNLSNYIAHLMTSGPYNVQVVKMEKNSSGQISEIELRETQVD